MRSVRRAVPAASAEGIAKGRLAVEGLEAEAARLAEPAPIAAGMAGVVGFGFVYGRIGGPGVSGMVIWLTLLPAAVKRATRSLTCHARRR